MGANFLGIDGGGSSTRVQVVNERGDLLFEARGGPSNVLVVGEERAQQELEALLPKDIPIDAVVAGLAGADRPWVQSFWGQGLEALSANLWVMGDYRIAWAALTAGDPGAIAIFGTGSVFYGERGATAKRLGGYGWKIGDVGSGIALGHAAILASLKALEECGPKTTLQDTVLQWSQCRDRGDLLNYLYADSTDWRSVSDLAQTVFTCAPTDAVAAAILEEAAISIMHYFHVLFESTDLRATDPVGLTGGLAPSWLEILNPRWKEAGHRSLSVTWREPVEGAVLLAKRLWQEKNERG